MQQMHLFDFISPDSFEDYVGKCEYCMWNNGTIGCPWDKEKRKKWHIDSAVCKDHDHWRPNSCKIPGLCGGCKHANSFEYEIKEKYKSKLSWNGYSSEAADDPEETPNIYCTRDGGSVNRRKPFERFETKNFGVGHWHRQHEWDTCDGWEQER